MNLNFSAAITILTKQEIIPTPLSLNFLIKYLDNLMETEFKYFFMLLFSCWGNVGQTSYTSISVGHGCEYQHVMTHEIGHVVR